MYKKINTICKNIFSLKNNFFNRKKKTKFKELKIRFNELRMIVYKRLLYKMKDHWFFFQLLSP